MVDTIKGDDICYDSEKFLIKITDNNPGLVVEGNHIKFNRVVFDVDFLDILPNSGPHSDKQKYVGILCKNCKNLTFEKCVLIIRYEASPGKVPPSDYPVFIDNKYLNSHNEEIKESFMGVVVKDSENITIDCLLDVRQTLSDGTIVRRVMNNNGDYQLYVNDIPISNPTYLNYC